MADRCDYENVAGRFGWLTSPGHRVVISPDLDGVTAAMILNAAVGCTVEGIYTLNSLWANPDIAGEDPERDLVEWGGLFLDHDINRRGIHSIGHHLLKWSDDTPIPEHEQGTGSLNPNLLRRITFRNAIRRKYPFSTSVFLIAVFTALDRLSLDPTPEVETYLMHIDSSFVNAINYQENALDWLEWLGGSGERSPLFGLCREILRLNPRRLLEAFRDLAAEFERVGLRPRRQNEIRNPNNEEDRGRLVAVVDWLTDKTGWTSPFGDLAFGDLRETPMVRQSTAPTRGRFEEVIRHRPFSYAILGSGPQSLNYNWFEGNAPAGA